MESSYHSFLQKVYSLQNYEHRPSVSYISKNFDLQEFRVFLSKLGDPQATFPSILITGTAGKGSTARMISTILSSNGFKTGLFTSPHLTDIRERIQIDNQLITHRDFMARGQKILDLMAQSRSREKGMRTFFEVLTALAYVHFSQEKIDIAVIEVGVGGRLDATNTVEPMVSVLTPIGLDHCHWLGNSLAEIASEKAGIIHPGSVVVCARQTPEAFSEISKKSQLTNSPVYYEGRDFMSEGLSNGFTQTFHYKGEKELKDIELSLPGVHQVQNAGLAITTIQCLEKRGFYCNQARLREALAQISWPARFEYLQLGTQKSPVHCLLDAAHNPVSIQTVVDTVKALFPQHRKCVLFAAASDKDYGLMLQQLEAIADRFVLTRFQNSRAATIADMHAGTSHSLAVETVPMVTDAVEHILCTLEPDMLLVITGSFFLIGEVKNYLREKYHI